MKKIKYSCSVCGSKNVLQRFWVDPNNMKVWDEVDASDEFGMCRECGEIVELSTEIVENELITYFKNSQENKDNPKYQDNIRYMEELEKIGKLDVENLRTCDCCGTPMIGGYYLGGELAFACSERCAIDMYEGGEKKFREDLSHAEEEGCETYWTQWDEVFLDIELAERHIKL